MNSNPVAIGSLLLWLSYNLNVVEFVEDVGEITTSPLPQRLKSFIWTRPGIGLIVAITAVLAPSQPVVVLYPDT